MLNTSTLSQIFGARRPYRRGGLIVIVALVSLLLSIVLMQWLSVHNLKAAADLLSIGNGEVKVRDAIGEPDFIIFRGFEPILVGRDHAVTEYRYGGWIQSAYAAAIDSKGGWEMDGAQWQSKLSYKCYEYMRETCAVSILFDEDGKVLAIRR